MYAKLHRSGGKENTQFVVGECMLNILITDLELVVGFAAPCQMAGDR